MSDYKFFDSHVHLNSEIMSRWFEHFARDYKDWIFNNISTNLKDFTVGLDQANRHKNVFLSAGIHPLEIDDLDMEETIKELDSKINDRVIAIGEVGLDFYRRTKESSFEKQKRWLVAQYALAKKHNLPLVLHIRDANNEAIELLDSVIDWYGVLHCYNSDLETAKRYLSLKGKWMISVSPIIFRGDGKLTRETIKAIDINRLLVESDAPYLDPHFNKVKELVEIIAEVKEMSVDECWRILLNNFREIFKIKI